MRGAADLIIASLALGALLTLGLFAANAATRGSPGGVGSRYALDSAAREFVTQTIWRDGNTHHVRDDAISLAPRGVTVPARTIRETHTVVETQTITSTVTKTETRTVARSDPVTVTVLETVTEQEP